MKRFRVSRDIQKQDRKKKCWITQPVKGAIEMWLDLYRKIHWKIVSEKHQIDKKLYQNVNIINLAKIKRISSTSDDKKI